MATIPTTCPGCSADCSRGIGQSFAPGKLVWSESLHCSACGCAIEADDSGFPPPEIRDLLIAAHGLWALQVELTGIERISACKILHCDLNTDFADVPVMKNRIPGIVYVGTKTEMQWLQSRLAEFDFTSTVVEIDHDSVPAGAALPIKTD